MSIRNYPWVFGPIFIFTLVRCSGQDYLGAHETVSGGGLPTSQESGTRADSSTFADAVTESTGRLGEAGREESGTSPEAGADSAGSGGSAGDGSSGSGGAASADGKGGNAGTSGKGGSAGTSGKGGNAGTSGMGGSSGTSASCDGSGDCSACIDCAIADPCQVKYQACNTNQSCLDMADCLNGCTDAACDDGCYDRYPEGAQRFLALAHCVICAECYVDCEGEASGCEAS